MMTQTMRKLIAPLILLLVIVALSACASTPPAKLSSNSWEVSSFYDGQNTLDVWPNSGITAVFGSDGQLSGNSGCNTYSATYTTNGNTIEIGPIAAAQMACDDEAMAKEAAYLAALQSAKTYEIKELILTLSDAASTVVVTYEQGPD